MSRKSIVLTVLVSFFAVVGGIIAGFIHLYLSDLPQIKFLEEYSPSASTRIFDSKGHLISELYLEKRKPVRLDQISPVFLKAILAVEDERFFDHVGIDIRAIFRAMWADFRSKSFAQGGSTITQQLTRNLFLEPDKSMSRKIKEALLAVQIENHYTKEEILELYCNQIYLGSGVYGLESSSQKYFGVPASDLNLTQAALIAGLPKAPSYYDPLKNPERAEKRRATVLRRMLEVNIISPQEYREALNAPLGIIESATSEQAPYFIEYIRQYLEERYGYAAVYHSGLNVQTTLDLPLQKAAERALKNGLESLDKMGGWRAIEESPDHGPPNENMTVDDLSLGLVFTAEITSTGKHSLNFQAGKVRGVIHANDTVFPYMSSFPDTFKNGQNVLVKVAGMPSNDGEVSFSLEQKPLLQGALIALDPRNGHILAMVGGYDFSSSQFNRAIQARRQPGSAIKPLIYATAIESGFTPSSILVDEPVQFWDQSKNDMWEPENYDGLFYGETTLLEALTHSRNIITIKLLNRLGVNNVVKNIRKMGIDSPMQPYLSLALGTSVLTPIEITSSYGVLANGGILCRPMALIKISDNHEKVLEFNQTQYEKVLDPDVAFVVVDMMRNVVNYGTGWRARKLGRPLAVKTGTTNDYQDAWFIGFSPSIAAGVWVGYDDNRSMGEDATGSSMAGPIWVDFMEEALSKSAEEEFHPSNTIVFREIDADSGLLSGPDCPKRRLAAFIKGTEPRQFCSHDE